MLTIGFGCSDRLARGCSGCSKDVARKNRKTPYNFWVKVNCGEDWPKCGRNSSHCSKLSLKATWQWSSNPVSRYSPMSLKDNAIQGEECQPFQLKSAVCRDMVCLLLNRIGNATAEVYPHLMMKTTSWYPVTVNSARTRTFWDEMSGKNIRCTRGEMTMNTTKTNPRISRQS